MCVKLIEKYDTSTHDLTGTAKTMSNKLNKYITNISDENQYVFTIYTQNSKTGPLRFCVAFFKIRKSTKNLGGEITVKLLKIRHQSLLNLCTGTIFPHKMLTEFVGI